METILAEIFWRRCSLIACEHEDELRDLCEGLLLFLRFSRLFKLKVILQTKEIISVGDKGGFCRNILKDVHLLLKASSSNGALFGLHESEPCCILVLAALSTRGGGFWTTD